MSISVTPSTSRFGQLLKNFARISSRYSLILKSLKHFVVLKVLRTPDFRNCNAAHEIRRKMKLMMDLYKQMTLEIISVGKCENVSEGQPLSGESKNEQKHMETHQKKRQADHSQIDYVPKKPPEEKNPLLCIDSLMKPKDGQILGTYIIGGSASGWNFIVYPGSKAVYYGVTKESFRAQK